MSKVDPYECMHQFEMAAELHVDRVDTHALLQMHPVSGLRREYCTCGLFEGSPRRARGPKVCLRKLEVTSELHVGKVATQALLQLLNVIKTTA